MGNKLVNFTVERTPFSPQYVQGDFKKQGSGNIHEGPNFNCHSLFIYSGIVLTEEQIMAHHDFFIRRYNVDADPVK